MNGKGIAIAGVMLVDKINKLGAYPNEGELTKILSFEQSVGGCVPNVAIDLKRMDSDLCVYGVGRVGKDAEGDFLKRTLLENGVCADAIVTGEGKTSYTEVMSVIGGQRTFFTYAGENAEFGINDIQWDRLNCHMLHLGYFLLMDKIDCGDGEKILATAQSRGIKTSIDLVSENSNRYQSILPCLKYTDNLIINEVEAGRLVGIQPNKDNLQEIAEKLKSYGVKDRVIIHEPDKGVCLSKHGFTVVPSYELSKGFIKGTTGAGDAFCAGALLQIYRGASDKKILEFASAAATAALSSTDAIGGMRSEEEIEILCKNFKRKKI